MRSTEAVARNEVLVAGQFVLSAGGGAATRVRVKICGLCSAEAARGAAAAGADLVGVIVGAGGPRQQSLDAAGRIFAACGAAQRVGVFADRDVAGVVEAARRLSLDVVQLHGDEAPESVRRVRAAGPWRVWKALRPRSAEEFERGLALHADVDGVLVDAWSASGRGGTGRRFDWKAIAPLRAALDPDTVFIAAGGLDPDNVAAAIACLGPDIVDVSSGVESAPCVKSPERMHAFVTNARAAVRGGR